MDFTPSVKKPAVHFGIYTQDDANDVKPFIKDNELDLVYVPTYYRKDEPTMLCDTYLMSGGKPVHMDTDVTVHVHDDHFQKNHTPKTDQPRDFYWKHNEPSLDMAAILKKMLSQKGV
ncbi:MAG TPA: hypothetical protein V6C52_14085 [Coleofasciculaceae cyanobacterium]